MIRIKTVHIEEFRGIRELNLNLGGANFGICGPNGTGKSGVVDAIEFCLTGSITRLSGQGQGELTVKGHGPHVDQRNNPESAKVSIVAVVPALGKEVTITRSLKNPRAVQIVPNNPQMVAIVSELQSHPEFALSRREIAKYVITPPAQRSTDVQTLLRLDHIGDLRKSFVSYSTKCKRDAEEAGRNQQSATQEMLNALGLKELDRLLVLEKANLLRAAIGLPLLTELTATTVFNDGCDQLVGNDPQIGILKTVAVVDLDAASKTLGTDNSASQRSLQMSAVSELTRLKEDAAALQLARAHGLIVAGLNLVNADACPLCDEPWEADELRAHLQSKLLNAAAVGETLDRLSNCIAAAIGDIEARVSAIKKVMSYGAKLEPAVSQTELGAELTRMEKIRAGLLAFRDDNSRLDDALSSFQEDWWSMPDQALERVVETHNGVRALPDNNTDPASFLAVLQDRYVRLLINSRDARIKTARADTAKKILDEYNNVSNEVLEGIYEAVAKEFTNFYKAINDDEVNFVGELKAEAAKMSFNVDFYGRGTFPPGAYHSEGHQDGMGLCLYLALMKHTLGDKFTFAVLDDVLMSVDTGHRREVCRLLKTQFPNTQFILTTHDRVWLKFMETEQLIKRGLLFGGWTVESGPRIWENTDIWTDVSEALSHQDVPRAAALLRRYLEYISNILADNLRAPVEYRGDANYDLGDLLPSVLGQWRSRLEKGKKAAQKWGHNETLQQLQEKLSAADLLMKKTNAEQWAINKSVHFNEWENFTSAEFAQVSEAFKALLNHMRCSNEKCQSFPYLTPRKGTSEQLRCNCGAMNINLKAN